MNVDWFFRIPYHVRVLSILLALALGLAVAWRPFVEWERCGGLEFFFSYGRPGGERSYPFVDFSQLPDALSPKWTPDGAHIVFATEGFQYDSTGDDLKTISELHVVGVDGSNLRTISDDSREYVLDHSPSVSPDGTRVAYSEYNHVNDNKRYEEIVTTALDGSERRRLTREVGLDGESEWLPNSDRIAFRRKSTGSCASRDYSIGGIYTAKSDGSTVRRVLSFKKEFGGHFALTGNTSWSPDRRTVAFFVDELLPERDLSTAFTYFKRTSFVTVDVNDSTITRLIVGAERPHHTGTKPSSFGGPSAWSLDGARIAFFIRGHERKVSLVTIDPDSGELNTVVDVPVTGALSWSPDGSQIMLAKAIGTVYLVQTDGSDIRLFSDVEVRGLGSFNATWSPDGSRVAVGMPGGSGVVLATVAPDGSDVRVLARRGEDGEVEAVGAGQHGSGPIDVITCARTKYPVNCLQVVNDRLVSRDECSSAFSEQVAAWRPGLAPDCEVIWELGRRATEIRQPDQFERTSWDRRTPVSEWEGVVVGETSTGLRVVELSLEGWNLTGPISGRLATELSKLTALESVDLSGNQLSGCIPEELRGKVIGYDEPEGCGE